MTDDDRARLVEELAEAMYGAVTFDGGYAVGKSELAVGATACLPIIEKLLAAHDLDALLDSVDCPDLDIDPVEGNEGGEQAYVAYIMPKIGGVWDATGPTRMDAIKRAVALAQKEGL